MKQGSRGLRSALLCTDDEVRAATFANILLGVFRDAVDFENDPLIPWAPTIGVFSSLVSGPTSCMAAADVAASAQSRR